MLLWLTPLLLLTYTTLRAKNLSMTHDECGSFLIWTDFPIFTCFYDPVCWGSANLHFLYVLLMKASIGLFGVSELALRLPALLGHAVYMFFSWKLISSWTSRHWLVLAGFLLLNLNPFQLEFFSLARGYGLANSCMMASLYFLYRYVQAEKTTAALAMFGWAVLAVMSNFTMLTYFACLTALFTGLVLVKKVKWQKPVLIAGGAAVLLTDLLYLPIKTLFEKGEFEYGTDTFWKSVHALVRASMYGVKYLREYNVQVLGGILLVLLTAALVSSIRAFLKAPQNRKNQFFLAASLLPLLASLSAIVQHHLLGTNYTLNRTSLLFIPMAALPVFLLFEHWLQQKSSWWRVVVPVLITGFVAGHAKRSF
ncbi:MAG: ArnT family glycosyltransferase, partial [Saprospiraceae bacterium]